MGRFLSGRVPILDPFGCRNSSPEAVTAENPVVMRKRDSAGSLIAIYLRPDTSSVTAADFAAEDIGLARDIAMPHLASPPGWLEIPSFYQLLDAPITLHRQSWGASDQRVAARIPYDVIPSSAIRRSPNPRL